MQISDTTNSTCIPAGDTIAAYNAGTTAVTLATATASGCASSAGGDTLTLTAETIATPGVPVLETSAALYQGLHRTLLLHGPPERHDK